MDPQTPGRSTSSQSPTNNGAVTRMPSPGWSDSELDQVLAEKKLTVSTGDKLLLKQILSQYREELIGGGPSSASDTPPLAANSSSNNMFSSGKFMAGRKPSPFEPATMDIRNYIRGFELYKNAAALSDKDSIFAFLTYLDLDCQGKMERRSKTGSETWSDFKAAAVEILDGPSTQSPLDARLSLKGAKQRAGESVQDFGERIRKLGETGFPEDGPAREANMRDALVAGVLKDEIGVVLIREMKNRSSFDELLREAKSLERSYKSRQVMCGMSENLEVSAMQACVLNYITPSYDFGSAPGYPDCRRQQEVYTGSRRTRTNDNSRTVQPEEDSYYNTRQ